MTTLEERTVRRVDHGIDLFGINGVTPADVRRYIDENLGGQLALA